MKKYLKKELIFAIDKLKVEAKNIKPSINEKENIF